MTLDLLSRIIVKSTKLVKLHRGTGRLGGSKNTYNVDDVGYVSASNVNMSVGVLNSVTFDQSVTWSRFFNIQ